MKFRTEIKIQKSSFGISHDDHALCVGSCFAEHMGRRLSRLKFNAHLNPFGIVYNPLSLSKSLWRILEGRPFEEDELVENQGLWHSFFHHGHFSKPDKKATLDHLNQSLTFSNQFIKKANRLILTLGTASVFSLRKTGEVVSNCHKFPGDTFNRRRLNVDEVAESLIDILRKLKEINSDLEVVATVSPVRHLRDGLIENRKSKATLLLGLEKVAEALPFIHYFPAYEMVLDDLRDYRFFESDLAHPNQQAVDYIWEHFSQNYFNENTRHLCDRINRIVTASEHRPLHPGSAAHQAFQEKELSIVRQLETEFPQLNFSEEKKKWGAGRL